MNIRFVSAGTKPYSWQILDLSAGHLSDSLTSSICACRKNVFCADSVEISDWYLPQRLFTLWLKSLLDPQKPHGNYL